jgi:peptidoglycan/LPS O-acetylase OafA/YrhL
MQEPGETHNRAAKRRARALPGARREATLARRVAFEVGHPVSPAAQGAFEPNPALRHAHRGVLAILVLCAAAIAATASAEASGPADPRYGLAAIAMAVGSILARRVTRDRAPSPWHARFSLASLLLAGGIGLVGLLLATRGGSRDTALLYVLGAAILSLRLPPAGNVGRRGRA